MFWSTEKLKIAIPKGNLVTPYFPNRIKSAAYELSLGPDALTTSSKDRKKEKLAMGESVVVHPGQFGVLLTEETVTIPNNAIGFISMRAKFKWEGLINVSGFHVDPGFSDRLKFAVYNASPSPIYISRGDRVFMLWFSDLDKVTEDIYRPTHKVEIGSDDEKRMSAEIASPGQLKKGIETLEHSYKSDIKSLQHSFDTLKTVVAILTTLTVTVGGIILAFLLRGGPQSNQTQTPTPPVLQQLYVGTGTNTVLAPSSLAIPAQVTPTVHPTNTTLQP